MSISTRKRLYAPLVPFAALAGRSAAAQDGTGGPAASTESWPVESWPVSTPEAHGLPADLAAQVDGWQAQTAPLMTSFVVIHDGDMIIDNHYNGFTPDDTFHIWSVTKSVTAIATGIAFNEGLLTSLDQTLGELIPDRIPASADPRVWDITLYHLLTSTSGWAWDGRINFSRHDETDDLDAMLARPMAFSPGEGFEYDSVNSNLLSYIVQVQSGVTMADYLQERMFDPMGIPQPEWIHMYQGETRGAGGLFLRPADLAKIGYMMLKNGEWAGQQLQSPELVAESTSAQASGTSSVSGVNIGGGGAYGYQWWVKDLYGMHAFYGNGYGGQTLYMVPDLDLIAVTGVAGTVVDRPDLQQPVLPIIEDLIVPAVIG
ncbi:MAG TPA: serine hydrolase [Thermomicrobiales bacterium]|jgi:CubicO group peptidase (beta-lactamase class C family)|nr:serine hydrolase [Thermomicrobiales bacterium]